MKWWNDSKKCCEDQIFYSILCWIRFFFVHRHRFVYDVRNTIFSSLFFSFSIYLRIVAFVGQIPKKKNGILRMQYLFNYCLKIIIIQTWCNKRDNLYCIYLYAMWQTNHSIHDTFIFGNKKNEKKTTIFFASWN